MRTAFIRELTRLAEADSRIFFITGDLGYSVIEDYASRFPDQFLNAGVAEQNMTGMAAGLASTGKVVFTYSIGNFPTIRALEQVRNDVCYHALNVKIVTVGGGLAYGALGYSHHAIEDLAIMRALPNMTVLAPGDPVEAAAATHAAVATAGPVYLRLGKAGEPVVHDGPIDFRVGRAITVRSGDAATICSTGGMLPVVVEAADRLAAEGVAVRVLSMHTLKPFDEDAILRAASETGRLITVEEHSIIGGLGSAVAEALATSDGPRATLHRIALPSAPTFEVGSHDHLRAHYGLTVEDIAAITRKACGS
jgi:transketolase